MQLRRSRMRWVYQPIAVVVAMAFVGADPGPSADWQARASPRLLAAWQAATTGAPAAAEQLNAPRVAKPPPPVDGVRYDFKGRAHVHVVFDCAGADPTAQLVAAGLVLGTTVKIAPECSVEGWASLAVLPAVASIPGVRHVDLPVYRAHRPHTVVLPQRAKAQATAPAGPGAIDGNGITIMRADQYVTTTQVSGAGATVGVISGDATNVAVITGRQELPAVTIVPQVSTGGTPAPHPTLTDEGTVMLEEVHAVAPSATLLFCGPETYNEYLTCLTNLIASGAAIISDDLAFPGYDVMSRNTSTQQVQTLLANNPTVMLFTSAGNDAQDYWQGSFSAAPSGTLKCNGQSDSFYQLFGPSGSFENPWLVQEASGNNGLRLFWADPYGHNASKFDLYVLDQSGNVLTCFSAAGSQNTFLSIPKGTLPSNTAAALYYFAIGAPDASAMGKLLKLGALGDGLERFVFTTPGGTFSPQALANGVITVGAVNGSDGIGNALEPFSEQGPIQLPFETPSALQSPVLAAPDMVAVDIVGTLFSSNPFGGTSAASPNAAAVAALLRSAFPQETPHDITGYLTAGATAIAAYGAVPNGQIGYGRVDAIGALAAVPMPTVSLIPAQTVVGATAGGTPVSFTVGGTGTLNVASASDNQGLISASGGLGLNCNGRTCMLTITPVIGQTGTASVTVTGSDGANRVASTQFVATVVKPAAPTANVTMGATQTITEGRSLTPATVVLTGTTPLTVTATTNSATLLSSENVQAGCGLAGALTCTVTFVAVAGPIAVVEIYRSARLNLVTSITNIKFCS